MEVNLIDLGLCEYAQSLSIQMDTLADVQKGNACDTLILVEHPAVITLGKHARHENIRSDHEWLQAQGISVCEVNRGGDVTYHGPGQLVVYFIFDLKKRHGGSIRVFVEKLEAVIIRLLQEQWGIQAGRNPCNAGVWVGEEKVAAIGLAVKRGVTMHGLALNVNTDLSHFDTIVPCGLAGKSVTSLEKLLGTKIAIEEVKAGIVDCICMEFGVQKYPRRSGPI